MNAYDRIDARLSVGVVQPRSMNLLFAKLKRVVESLENCSFEHLDGCDVRSIDNVQWNACIKFKSGKQSFAFLVLLGGRDRRYGLDCESVFRLSEFALGQELKKLILRQSEERLMLDQRYFEDHKYAASSVLAA